MDHLTTPVYSSDHLEIGLACDRPAFTRFSIDALGQVTLSSNPKLIRPIPEFGRGGYVLEVTSAATFTYIRSDGGTGRPSWSVNCRPRQIELRSEYQGHAGSGFQLLIDQRANHATLLGRMAPGERKTSLPCVLHLPDMGSVRIGCSLSGHKLDYDASRDPGLPHPFVQVTFPPADAAHPRVIYTLEVVAIHPEWPGLTDEVAFDGFRRSALNIFQMQARLQMLANNSASDPCPFTLFTYAKAARQMPPLAPGLTANDLVRMTLDRYLAGVKGYGHRGYGADFTPAMAGLIGWGDCPTSLDTLPSLLIASCEYIAGSGDHAWAERNYPALSAWGREMLAADMDGNGLLEYPSSGNYGDRPTTERHPANWWDTINFGHEDALSNALAYQASEQLSRLASTLGQDTDQQYFRRSADRIRAAYVPTFLNPSTGVLAGWRSRDGELHDYWFTFIQGAAISFGLVGRQTANAIMDRLLVKMSEVGFANFALGLPGNLVPIRRGDYWQDLSGTIPPERYGEPRREDGADGFPYYENGGASGCWAYFTIHALYRLGRFADARRIFLPMLRGYAAGSFQGVAQNGMMRDWRDWQGGGHGYEGLLVDNYLPLMAVEDELAARHAPASIG